MLLGFTSMAVFTISMILFDATDLEIFGYLMLITLIPIIMFGYLAIIYALQNIMRRVSRSESDSKP